MLLAIDVGNTNTVFAVYRGDELMQNWRLQTSSKRSADEYASFLNQLLQLCEIAWSDFSDVIISSVVPDANFHLGKFCQKFVGCDPVFVSKDLVDIDVTLDKPEEAGADRLVNALAAREFYQAPAVVIDFGTATTFDVIDEAGAYSGGLIAPGINLSIEALNRAAAKLPMVSVKKTERVIGKNTVGAIQSGIYWGYIGLIEGILERIKAEMDATPYVVATGGLAPLFIEGTDKIDCVDGDLTLKGLLYIHKKETT